jgi:Fe-S cluster assembly protein SufD
MEEWRYSRIDELDLSRFTAPSGGEEARAALARELAAEWANRLGEVAAMAVFVDGALAHLELAPDAPITILRSGDADWPAELTAASEAEIAADFYGAANGAIADPIVVVVAAGAELDGPIVVVDHQTADSTVSGSFLGLTVGAGSRVSLVEIRTSAKVDALTVPRTFISVEADATLDQDVVIDTDGGVWNLGRCHAAVAEHAQLHCAVAVVGGLVSRLRYDCELAGVGARGDLSAVYLGDADRSVDLRTFQVHDAPSTTSELTFAGAVDDRSHAIYTGMIRIHPNAPKTEAHQRNRILKLSDQSWAESVPNLEILNNDVICSHASAVGPIDEDERFYLESRGVEPVIAERLVVSGFLAAQSRSFANAGVAAYVAARIDQGVRP